MFFKLNRITPSNPHDPMLGNMTVVHGMTDKTPLKVRTLERPWADNKRRVSCIPVGDYLVKLRYSPKFKNHFIVCPVHKRSYILIHIGNRVHETNGCILVGMRHGVLEDESAVLSSRIAFEQILSMTQNIKYTCDPEAEIHNLQIRGGV